MGANTFSAIARPIDLNYPTNRAIAVLVLLFTAGGTVVRVAANDPLLKSGQWGLQVGFSLFFAWALCREIDPDNDLSAFLGAGLTLPGVLLWGFPGFFGLLWVLVMLRILNRSVGLPAKAVDSLGLVILGAVLVYRGHLGFGVLTAVALFCDARLPSPQKRQVLFAWLCVVSMAFILIFNKGSRMVGELHWAAAVGALGLSIVFVPVMLRSKTIKSTGDTTGEPLIPVRILAGQSVALLAGTFAALGSGAAGLRFFVPLWGAVLGAALFIQIKTVLKIRV